MPRLAWIAVSTAALISLSGSLATAEPVDETRPDVAALRAIVDHWDAAERDGDVAYLAQLMAPEYRSIGGNGEATTRAALLEQAEHTRSTPGAAAERRKAGAAFLLAHPTEVAVAIHGQVGIVSYYAPKRGLDHSVRGSDIFVYEGNRWYAIYAMHNKAD